MRHSYASRMFAMTVLLKPLAQRGIRLPTSQVYRQLQTCHPLRPCSRQGASRQHDEYFNTQLISLLDGTAVIISDPLPGKTHDAEAYEDSGIAKIVDHFKGWRIFHIDYRRPYRTYCDAFDDARGLFFFAITWGFE
jgi:hypothetical protein